MGAAAARSGAPCVPTATPGPWDIPPAIGDGWFIHYPIYTGCVAARLETRSAAQRADHKTVQKTAAATPALATAPQKALARRQKNLFRYSYLFAPLRDWRHPHPSIRPGGLPPAPACLACAG